MKRFVLALTALLAIALFAFGCKKETNTNTDTVSSTTSTSATDTSGTTMTGTTSTTSTAAATPWTKEEQDFATKAAIGGLAEVQMGQLAASKATNPDVKAFGQRMVTDHGKANDDLKQVATAGGVTLPAQLDAEHQKKADELSKKNGKDFDKAYMDEMVKDHEKDVAEFKKEASSTKDTSDLHGFVTRTLPTLEDHLKMAKETQKKVK